MCRASRRALLQAEKAIDYVLGLIASRLGLDSTVTLGGPAAIPVMTRYYVSRGAKPLDHASATSSCTGTCTPSCGAATPAPRRACWVRTWRRSRVLTAVLNA